MAAQALGLHELYQQAKAITYGIWRKRWYMLVTAWLIALVGWGAVYTMPYRYAANARIYVDADTLLPSIAKSLGVAIDTSKKIEAIRKTLVSRPNLEKIVRRSEYLERLAQNSGELDGLISRMQREVRIIALDEGHFQIQYEVDERRLSDRQRAEVAKTVVSNLLAFFRVETGQNSAAEATNVANFLEDTIKDLSERLNAAEAAHAKFEQDNIEYLGNVDFLSRLENARSDLKATRNQIAELKVTQQTLAKQLESVPQTIKRAASSNSGGGKRDPLDERLADLQKKLDKLYSLGYKDLHPDVRNLKRQLESVKAEKVQQMKDLQAELSGSAEEGKTSNLTTETPNRLYEQLMLENIGTISQISGLEQRELEHKNLVDELEEKAKKVPEILAEKSALKRGYDTLRRQHTKLLKERADNEIRISVSSGERTVAFRVVEPPVTPQSPSGPPRMLYMSAVLVGALVAGLGVALVLSQLKPVVITVEQLRNHFDLPVLGNVTRAMSDAETRQRSMEMLGFAGATMVLFLVFAGFVLVDIFGSPTVG